jgi:exopolyphosphatase/guanosine-5'-triphosphate,3'-diphosphate pyrophosphatase
MTQESAPSSGPLAAIDLGSNSFHLLLAEEVRGEVRVVDRIKERVGLASGLTRTGRITREARERALDCLARFHQPLEGLDPGRVRAVGTNTFRAAKDGGVFLGEASARLGFPIEIVSGAEEARLVYAGVRFASGFHKRRILAIDIGGGSTELVVGKGDSVELAESLRLGCVTWSERFFPGGAIEAGRLHAAVRAARLSMRSVARRLRETHAERFVGSSGTALAIAAVIEAMGWEPSEEAAGMAGHFTRGGLLRLRDALVAAGSVEGLELRGLSAFRAPVFAGGVAIMLAVFDALEIERLVVSDGALREGLLAEILGRLHQGDGRDSTVLAMAQRFSVDMEQAGRVASTGALLFEVARKPWTLRRKREGLFLRWGALLHELGLSVSHDAYRKHGSYLVANADLAGFTRNEQERLAALVFSHRGRLRPELFAPFREELRVGLVAAALLLRIARILHRSRSSRPLPAWSPKARSNGEGRVLALGIPQAWSGEHPLTRADLEEEGAHWRSLGYELVID